MTNKIKYPMEAFALAAVLFSAGMKEAMLVGIALIFGDILQCVLQEFAPKQYAQTMSTVGAVITCGAMYLMYTLTGIAVDAKHVMGFAVLGFLLVKHQEDRAQKSVSENGNEEDAEAGNHKIDYNAILLSDSVAYGIYVLFAIIREYLTNASVFETTLPECIMGSAAFGKPMMVLVGVGLMIAMVNRVLRSTSKKNAALFVCIPVLLLETPFVWNNVPEWIGSIVGMVTCGILYVTLRKKLAFSETEKHIEGLPVELVMLGVIYMIFGLL